MSRTTLPAQQNAAKKLKACQLSRRASHLPPPKAAIGRSQESVVTFALEGTGVSPAVQSKCPVLRAAQGMPVPQNPTYPWTSIRGVLDIIFRDSAEVTAGHLRGRPIVQQQVLGRPCYVMGTQEMAVEILRDADRFKQSWPTAVQTLLGPQAVANLSDSNHSRIRNLILPYFKPAMLARYIPLLQQIVEDLFDEAVDASKANQPSPLADLTDRYTFDAISRAVMGFSEKGNEQRELQDLVRTVTGALFLPTIDLPFLPYGKALQARKEFDALTMGRIEQVRLALAAGERPPEMLTEFLLAKDEDGNSLTDQQLLDNFLMLLFAGNDTTASVLTTLCYHLMQQPQLMEALAEEQRAVQELYGPDLTSKALQQMPLVECCFAEAIRIKHPVGAGFRQVAEDTQVGGYAIPRGSTVSMPTAYLTHNVTGRADETGGSTTGEYALDRFNPYRYRGQPDSVWKVAFGAGPHSCLGAGLAQLEAKVFIAVLARQFRLRLAEDTTWVGPVPRPLNGLLAYVERV